ncbi:MAG TPA: hypothetical protein VNT79_16915 [Phycisphaerae bacterium]|nr:hypothetical protein [Phycisphaerae bacterium]
MNVRDAILQRFRDRIMRMRGAFERFNDEAAEREMVGPRWNVRDLAGHFLFWTTEAGERMPEVSRAAAGFVQSDDEAANARAIEKLLPQYDLDRVNEATHRKYRRMSFVMLLPQLREAEERLLQAVGGVDAKCLIGDTPLRSWIDIHLGHYEKHWPGLKAAAERAAR